MMPTRPDRLPRRAAPLAALVLVALAPAAPSQSPPRPQLHVVRGVRLGTAPDAPVGTLVLREGRIDRVLERGAQEPPAARIVEGEGLIALAAFIDACTQAGCETPTPQADQDLPVSTESDVRIDMREANRKGIQPAFRAAEALDWSKTKREKWREAGFGSLLSAPGGQLLAGSCALAATRDAAPRDALVEPDVFMAAAFRAGGQGYPGTLMGYTAQLRQFFLDAQRQRELEARHAEGRPGLRPPFDPELEAAMPLLEGERRLLCDAESANDIRRWLALGDELGFQVAIRGGREAWKLAGELAERDVPVILTLEWGDEVEDPHAKEKQKAKQKPGAGAAGEGPAEAPAEEPPQSAPEGDAAPEEAPPEAAVPAEAGGKAQAKSEPEKGAKKKDPWNYEEPLGVREERRREWEEGRDCAIRLEEAGVRFAFGSAGGDGAALLKKVRQVVEAGLPRDAALEALTSGAAEILGAGRLGALEPGRDATLALWTADPLDKDAKLAWLFVDGFPHEFDLEQAEKQEGKPDEGVDPTGTWRIEFTTDRGSRTGTAELSMDESGAVTGTVTTEAPGGEGETVTEYSGIVVGKTMTLEGTMTIGEREMKSTIDVELEGDAFSGQATTSGPWGERTSSVSGARDPKNAMEVR